MQTLSLKQKIANIQEDIGVLEKDKTNPFFKSEYLSLPKILIALKPLEKKYKVLIKQPLSNVNGRPSIKLKVEDLESLESEVEEVTIPELQDPQKMGSAISYFKRYQLVAYFKILDEDDDGQSASNTVKVKSKVAEMEEDDDLPF